MPRNHNRPQATVTIEAVPSRGAADALAGGVERGGITERMTQTAAKPTTRGTRDTKGDRPSSGTPPRRGTPHQRLGAVCVGRPVWDAEALRRLRQVVDIALLRRAGQRQAARGATEESGAATAIPQAAIPGEGSHA